MADQISLTERQLTLLQWVANGCPEGVVEGVSYRISVRALHNRELVRISGRGSAWRAKLTPAGQAYLKQTNSAVAPVPNRGSASVTQQLVDDVIAAGGVLRVPRPRWGEPGSVDFTARARLAERYRKVPAGKRLSVAMVDAELEISLVDAPEIQPVELAGVLVPEHVARYHEVAKQFRERRQRHEVSRALVSRATQIVHAIAAEAVRRGWHVGPPPDVRNAHGYMHWSGTKHGHIAISASDLRFWLRVHEEGVATRGPWELTVAQVRELRRSPWSHVSGEPATGPYDGRATGRLKLELFGEGYSLSRGRQSRWADGKRWTVEERLPHLFREVEERIAVALQAAEDKRVAEQQAAEAAKREAEERERQWSLLMEKARERLVAASRATRLRAELGAWRESDAIRRYCSALEERHGADCEWAAWSRSYAELLDPLSVPPVMPAPPEPTPEALQPHLPQGWSAQGPHEGLAPERRAGGIGYRR